MNLSDTQLSLFQRYADALLEWNKKVNLISRRDEEYLWDRHILHSISLAFHVRLPGTARVLDLGSGGGLPGIPLKILFPELIIVLLDSIQKKVLAVQNIIQQLSLSGITAVRERAEEFAGRPLNRHTFDFVVARGVAPLDRLVRLAEPLLRRGQQREAAQGNTRIVIPPALIAYKGGDLGEEVRKVRLMRDDRLISVIDLGFNGNKEGPMLEKKLIIVSF